MGEGLGLLEQVLELRGCQDDGWREGFASHVVEQRRAQLPRGRPF